MIRTTLLRACVVAVTGGLTSGCASSCEPEAPEQPSTIALAVEPQQASLDVQDEPAHAGPRAVSLIPNITEIVYAIGADDHLVGRSQDCNFPEAARDVRSIGSGLSPDVETILSLQPDVVLGTSLQLRRAWARALQDAGAEFITVPDTELDDIPRGIRIVGEALQAEGSAEALASDFESRLQELRDRAAPEAPPSVLLVIGMDPLYVSGPESRMEPLVRFAGGINALATGSWVQLESEALVAADPDVVVILGPDQRQSFETRYAFLRAVEQAHVCDIEADVIARPGPRILDAVIELEECLALLSAGTP